MDAPELWVGFMQATAANVNFQALKQAPPSPRHGLRPDA
jgi:hypothetical protein